jgi:hypothetical protein
MGSAVSWSKNTVEIGWLIVFLSFACFLRRHSVVVLNSTEHGERNQLPAFRRWYHQFRTRLWDSVQRLRRPSAVVEFNVFSDYSIYVATVEEDEVVQRLFSERTVPPLKTCVCVGSPIWCGDSRYVHHLAKPLVQPAAKRATMSGLSVDCPRPVPICKLSEDAVVVMNQKPRHHTRSSLAQLLHNPFQRWVVYR